MKTVAGDQLHPTPIIRSAYPGRSNFFVVLIALENANLYCIDNNTDKEQRRC